ncbi:MAG: hypothetical protein RLZZ522_686 [Verrucomicrobiota bacterium]
MNIRSVILPFIALALVSALLGTQRRAMATLETECARLRTHIAAAKSPSTATALPHEPLEKRRKVLEWRNIAAQFPSNPRMVSHIQVGAAPDQRVRIRFRQRMDAMSISEIIAALDEVAALRLPAESREGLEWTLLESVVLKDPGLGLELIKDRGVMNSFHFNQLISDALLLWAKKDAVAAGAWFDQQIAAGEFKARTLDGVSHPRQMFESSLVSMLLTKSPEAAARRLAALPEDQRGDVLHMYSLTTVPEECQLAHAQLVRTQVPAKEQPETIASQASFLIKPGDYSAVTAYLERIDATPAERAACAMKAVQNMNPKVQTSNHLTRDDFDDLRDWVGSQAPDSMDTVTGMALGEAAQGNRKMEFAAAAELAVEYSVAGGDDEVLATFLASWAARSNKEAARALAGNIVDEKRRAEILASLK